MMVTVWEAITTSYFCRYLELMELFASWIMLVLFSAP